MTTQPKFDRNPKGNFAEENAFTQVVFGTDSMLLEDELNEMQAIQQQLVRPLYDMHGYDGLKSILEFSVQEGETADLYVLPEFHVQVDGRMIRVAGVGNDGQQPGIPAASNLLSIEKSEGSWDLLFLEVKEVVVGDGVTLYLNGVQDTPFQLENKLTDPRIGQETARRIQVQSKLRVQKNIASTYINASAMSQTYDPEGSLYVYEQNGRWRSENNYCAIPLGVMISFASDPFTPATTDLKFFDQRINLTYDQNGDVTEVVASLGDFELSRTSITYIDYFVDTVTVNKDGRVTKYDTSNLVTNDGDIEVITKQGY